MGVCWWDYSEQKCSWFSFCWYKTGSQKLWVTLGRCAIFLRLWSLVQTVVNFVMYFRVAHFSSFQIHTSIKDLSNEPCLQLTVSDFFAKWRTNVLSELSLVACLDVQILYENVKCGLLKLGRVCRCWPVYKLSWHLAAHLCHWLNTCRVQQRAIQSSGLLRSLWLLLKSPLEVDLLMQTLHLIVDRSHCCWQVCRALFILVSWNTLSHWNIIGLAHCYSKENQCSVYLFVLLVLTVDVGSPLLACSVQVQPCILPLPQTNSSSPLALMIIAQCRCEGKCDQDVGTMVGTQKVSKGK